MVDAEVTWSPDGNQLTFLRPTNEGHQIYTMDFHGNETLLLDGKFQVYGLDWSSDGNTIVFASPKGTANFLTRMTAFCAAAFFVTSLTLGVLAGTHSSAGTGILDSLEETSASIEAPLVQDDTAVEGDEIPAPTQEQETEDNGEIPSAPIAE